MPKRTNGIELLLTGEVRDIDVVATVLARSNYYYVRGELIRMYREQEEAVAGAPPPRG